MTNPHINVVRDVMIAIVLMRTECGKVAFGASQCHSVTINFHLNMNEQNICHVCTYICIRDGR